MNPENITNLKDIIELKLSPMINDEYIFLDLPYYKNIGDALIWKGTEEFLKKSLKNASINHPQKII